MKLYITAPFGLGKVLASELKFLGLPTNNTFESGTFSEGNREDIARINLWSRIAHRVFAGLSVGQCLTFEQLFDQVALVNWKQYIHSGSAIEVQIQTHQSQLTSIRTIQSIAHKAIFKSLGIIGGDDYKIDDKSPKVIVFVVLYRDSATIYVDTSGKALHERGYRLETGEAPIKENLAAGLVLLSRWLFKKPLWDPMCGSGTICIEAAMIARNIAPGLQRIFLCEQFTCLDPQVLATLREEAKNQIFTDKKYEIIGSDHSEKAISSAQQNAVRAGVSDTIVFRKQDFLTNKDEFTGRIITNPPYNERMQNKELVEIYDKLNNLFDSESVHGGYITSLTDIGPSVRLKNKFIKNGGIECDFWHD